MSSKWNKETVCLYGGYAPKAGEPRILPIVQSTTYLYDDPDQVAKLFDLAAEGHMYSRISNPTVAAFEAKVAQLEGGVGAVATASGQAATTLALLNICQSGEHVLAASTLYGGTHTLLSTTMKKLGIDVTFVHPNLSVDEIVRQSRPETKAVFAETIGNPDLNVLDFEKFAKVAQQLGVPLIVDNTLATPLLCQPFQHGANIVIHSSTKYIDGHATSVGGVIVDGGNFDWGNGKFPELTEPDPAYHGLRYVATFGQKAYITKARVQLLRDLGFCLSPFNAFLQNLGLETLHLRMERHSQNALQLAQYLQEHEQVTWVKYPKLTSHPDYALAERYLPQGAGGMVTFGIKGGVTAGKEWIRQLELVALVVHLGDARTSLLHPASTTHRQLSEEQLIAAGVTPDLIRLSVGIENISDVIEDFTQAFKKIGEIQ